MSLDALLLDAGNTVVFLAMPVVAEIARGAGIPVAGDALVRAEGAAKRRYEARLLDGGSHEEGWNLYFVALFAEVGIDEGTTRALLPALTCEHERLNLWRRVPPDLPAAIDRAKAAGLRVGVISNSEGRLPELFDVLGLGDAFEVVVDSAIEGVRKPDPRLFHLATTRLGVDPGRALYAGDLPSVDVAGARAAGLKAALIDTLDFYPDFVDAPRYRSVADLVDALLEQR